jgi:hypothetical protein
VRAQAFENEDLLALVAMPLAVAAVSEVTDVPMNQLMDVVSLLNDAAVPPPQFIEVVRYVPVALLVEAPEGPAFPEYIRLREGEGLRGTDLVNSIEDRLRVYDVGVVNLRVDRARVDIDDNYVPPIVRDRIAEARRSHPHGGPPGQLKNTAGVQTGAEIVHGTRPNRVPSPAVASHANPKRPKKIEHHVDRPSKAKHAAAPKAQDLVATPPAPRAAKPEHANRGGAKSHGGGKGHGNGHGKGKG